MATIGTIWISGIGFDYLSRHRYLQILKLQHCVLVLQIMNGVIQSLEVTHRVLGPPYEPFCMLCPFS